MCTWAPQQTQSMISHGVSSSSNLRPPGHVHVSASHVSWRCSWSSNILAVSQLASLSGMWIPNCCISSVKSSLLLQSGHLKKCAPAFSAVFSMQLRWNQPLQQGVQSTGSFSSLSGSYTKSRDIVNSDKMNLTSSSIVQHPHSSFFWNISTLFLFFGRKGSWTGLWVSQYDS